MNAISPDAENVRRALPAKGIETPMIDPTQCKDERWRLLRICVK